MNQRIRKLGPHHPAKMKAAREKLDRDIRCFQSNRGRRSYLLQRYNFGRLVVAEVLAIAKPGRHVSEGDIVMGSVAGQAPGFLIAAEESNQGHCLAFLLRNDDAIEMKVRRFDTFKGVFAD